jgi:hypothetical protein
MLTQTATIEVPLRPPATNARVIDCPACGGVVGSGEHVAICQFCRAEIPTGRIDVWCDRCGKMSCDGEAHYSVWRNRPVCEDCVTRYELPKGTYNDSLRAAVDAY